jgi:hypothetical protein
MVSSKELMKQRAAEADRLIAEIAAPQVNVESPEDAVSNGADNVAQPTDAPIDALEPEITVSTDAGAEIVAAPQEPAIGEAELASLRTEVKELKDALSESEQRYRTLQGMIIAKDQDIAALRTTLAALGDREAPAAVEEPLVSDKDKETYGEELIDLIKRVTKQQVAPLMAEVDSRVQNVAQVATTSAMQRFEAELDKVVPDWLAINDSPEFVAWLGKYNLKALNEAYGAMDIDGTAKFFKDFKSLTAPAPAATAAPAPVVAPVDKLESLSAPAKSKVTPINPDGNRGRIWTGADVSKLYKDHAAKRITHAEFEKLEADLFKAQTEGRIAA